MNVETLAKWQGWATVLGAVLFLLVLLKRNRML